MDKLTRKQQHVLDGLRAAHPHTPSSRNLADRLDVPHYRATHYNRAEVHSVLTRLEGKGLVTRVGDNPVQWAARSV